MCNLENQALMTAFDYLIEQNIEVGSLVFDGLMIYKDNMSLTRLDVILVGLGKQVKDVMGCGITFTNKVMDEGYDIPILTKGDLNLLLRKGVFPYEYVDSVDKLNETSLPVKSAFYSRLSNEEISDADYEHARKVWDAFGCASLRDYLEVYNESDVLLNADIFENFRDACIKKLQLRSGVVLWSPGLAWDAALKSTDITLELLSDPDMLLMVKRGIKGGICLAPNRYLRANNKYMDKSYNSSKASKFITYLDANNLYGWAMSKPFPTHGFKWMEENDLENWENLPDGYGFVT